MRAMRKQGLAGVSRGNQGLARVLLPLLTLAYPFSPLLTLVLAGESSARENRVPPLLQKHLSKEAALLSKETPPGEIAGEIFGVPVPMSNYLFIKAVAAVYPRPWGAADGSAEEQEIWIWESMILHYESFRRKIEPTEEEIDSLINDLLRNQKQPFKRKEDPAAYRRWVKENLGIEVPHFENQVRFLRQIRKLKDQIREESKVSVSEEEMHQEFLNEKNHVGGEMVTFESKEEAAEFYDSVKDPAAWEAMKQRGEPKVRPVSLMTLEAYIDLWQIPKEQMFAFHALEIGQIGPPMPFGKQWCVYRLLDRRVGDLEDFPKEREAYLTQVTMKKKYQALEVWIKDLQESARLKVFVKN